MELDDETKRILDEFLASQNTTIKTTDEMSMSLFKEDWQLSQFWNTAETCEAVALEILSQTDGSILCISSPSVFLKIQALNPTRAITLYEVDRRFDILKGFVFYDYNSPKMEGRFDYVFLDPPFLSRECLSKMYETAKGVVSPEGKIGICTASILEHEVKEIMNCEMTTFAPQHQNGLANEFRFFCNYSSSLA